MSNMIQINFTKTTPDGVMYSDAIYLPENHTYTQEEIEAMKQQRYDNWLIYLSTPKVSEDANTEANTLPTNDE